MIISEDKILFIHIPKTGGTSIGNIIHPELPIGDTKKRYRDFIDNNTISVEHNYYVEYELLIGPDIDNYFIFTFVRNPYSRLFSLWRQCCIAHAEKTKSCVMSCPLEMTETKQYLYDSTKKILFHKFVAAMYNERENIHLLGNTQYAIVKPEQANFIGKYENFDSDINRVINLLNHHIGIQKFRYQKLHLNQNSTHINEYKKYYNSYIKKLVQKIYMNDFIAFNYPIKIR